MKREIKFRGKAKDDGTWVHGDLTTGDTIHTSPSWHEDGEGEWWGHECHEETIGQYTGLKDKNGKEIYEGDIFKFAGLLYEVRFKKGCFLAYHNGEQMGIIAEYPHMYEVVGNIFDNKELIKH